MEIALRKRALEWWNALSQRRKFFHLLTCEDEIVDAENRQLNSLTGREIELIWKRENQKKVNNPKIVDL